MASLRENDREPLEGVDKDSLNFYILDTIEQDPLYHEPSNVSGQQITNMVIELPGCLVPPKLAS